MNRYSSLTATKKPWVRPDDYIWSFRDKSIKCKVMDHVLVLKVEETVMGMVSIYYVHEAIYKKGQILWAESSHALQKNPEKSMDSYKKHIQGEFEKVLNEQI